MTVTFLEAIASGRPMRRKLPGGGNEWLSLGYHGANDVVGTPTWREVRSGEATGLRRSDYEATDWETLP
jgi:hypothetical protein